MSIAGQDEPSPRAALSWWFLVFGFLLILGTSVLAARLVWEQTMLSWEQGPQMVGFSLAHGGGVLLFIFPLLLAGWLLVAVVYLGWRFWQTRQVAPSSLQAVCSAIGLLAILSLPQGFWVRLFIDRFANGPYASEFFVNAAATGDLSTIKSFLAHGVPVDIRDREKKIALYGAAVGGKTDVIAYLVSKGAEVNVISIWGDSPLEVATTEEHPEAAKFLAEHGGVRVRGTAEQRDKAAEAIVREDIKKMDSLSTEPKPR